MSNSGASSPARKQRRWRRWLLVPLLVVLLLAVLLVWAAIRGTWADAVARNPQTSAEGVVRQLYLAPDGHKYVRCAAILDHPIETVWQVVTDYERFDDIFPHLESSRATRQEDGRWHLTGVVSAGLFGEWTFEAHITHEESPDRYEASWNEPDRDLDVNRGSWTLHRLEPDRTLLVYALEVEPRGYPVFAVRNVLLSRVPALVAAVGAAIDRRERRG